MIAVAHPQKFSTEALKSDELPTYDARNMIGDGVQARVLLDGQSYYLRITRAGKLILTK